jgi:hypothetical protein
MEPPKQLPQASALEIEQIKVVDYLLNVEHKQGGPKAKYFRNRGFQTRAVAGHGGCLAPAWHHATGDGDPRHTLWEASSPWSARFKRPMARTPAS